MKIRSNSEKSRFTTPKSLIDALILLLAHKQTIHYLPLKLLLRNFQILLLWVITTKTTKQELSMLSLPSGEMT